MARAAEAAEALRALAAAWEGAFGHAASAQARSLGVGLGFELG